MASELEGIRHALSIARDRGYAQVVVHDGDLKFKASLEPNRAKRVAEPEPESESAPSSQPEETGLQEIRSPLVGYFRAGDVPVAPGQVLKVGDVVGVVSSLGDIPYAVEATAAGEVSEVLVTSDQPVEFGQVLLVVKP